jgi:TM2 domain-containing membrane protein YozV
MAASRKSKLVAVWLALVAGPLGAHRFYLHGIRDVSGWLFWPFTLAGLAGVQRMRAFGVDDRVAWLLIPLLGLAIAAAMLGAIVTGLTPDERWNARHNPASAPSRTNGLVILGVVFALMIGAGCLMATIAFTGQHVFEVLLEPAGR